MAIVSPLSAASSYMEPALLGHARGYLLMILALIQHYFDLRKEMKLSLKDAEVNLSKT
jgi:hypothetical protein